MAVKYVGERVGRYDRYERPTRKNANRWMNPQPVGRRTNRVYEESKDPDLWLYAIVGTFVFVFVLWLVGLLVQ